jgi:hypothetical protein
MCPYGRGLVALGKLGKNLGDDVDEDKKESVSTTPQQVWLPPCKIPEAMGEFSVAGYTTLSPPACAGG